MHRACAAVLENGFYADARFFRPVTETGTTSDRIAALLRRLAEASVPDRRCPGPAPSGLRAA